MENRCEAKGSPPSGVSEEADGDTGMQEETRAAVGMLGCPWRLTRIIWENTKILSSSYHMYFFSLLGKCGGMGSLEGVWVPGTLSISIQGAVGGIQVPWGKP